jgi:hypothetical protein
VNEKAIGNPVKQPRPPGGDVCGAHCRVSLIFHKKLMAVSPASLPGFPWLFQSGRKHRSRLIFGTFYQEKVQKVGFHQIIFQAFILQKSSYLGEVFTRTVRVTTQADAY